jgi:hypothetical protein
VGVLKPGFLAIYADISLSQTDLSQTDGLNLTALQSYTSFVPFQQEILMAGFTVGGDHFEAALHGLDFNIGWLVGRSGLEEDLLDQKMDQVPIWLEHAGALTSSEWCHHLTRQDVVVDLFRTGQQGHDY